ncbi:MAG: UDP-N-acetylglucosamine 2-epimerase (non-hydrolyzing), partial [Sphingopyxis sp.]|nr:UDP-N-acetylglucosamine 2-epimerase (non-hydrolyzing) [Sphingopyxis sp.]
MSLEPRSETGAAASRIAVVFGTRPEAIKMMPVVHALRARPGLDVRVCVTAQHREMLDQVLEIARIFPDVDLDVMTPNQSLDALLARLVTGLGDTFDRETPDRILVHGDTLTTMAATLAAYFRKIPVGHVEAGLRSGDRSMPEEINRLVTDAIADVLWTPSPDADENLRHEGVPASRIDFVGNIMIDSYEMMRPVIEADRTATDMGLARGEYAVVTLHRPSNVDTREALGPLVDQI